MGTDMNTMIIRKLTHCEFCEVLVCFPGTEIFKIFRSVSRSHTALQRAEAQRDEGGGGALWRGPSPLPFLSTP